MSTHDGENMIVRPPKSCHTEYKMVCVHLQPLPHHYTSKHTRKQVNPVRYTHNPKFMVQKRCLLQRASGPLCLLFGFSVKAIHVADTGKLIQKGKKKEKKLLCCHLLAAERINRLEQLVVRV